jgi:hypothetical protein
VGREEDRARLRSTRSALSMPATRHISQQGPGPGARTCGRAGADRGINER